MAPPVIIFLIVIYGYSMVIFLFYLEIERDPEISGDHIKNPRHVSVIVPFRNEADHLPGILNDLAAQSYPDDFWEVIFVNDHSEDGSLSMLESLLKSQSLKNREFYCYSLPPDRSGKKSALSLGIGRAKHEWIIQVDSDCRVGPRFIESHISFLEKHPSDLIAGVVTTGRGRGNFLEIFERLDMLSLVGSGAGSFGLGRPMMCNGANLAYSRELYMETRSFDPEISTTSGDDMFLMIGARKLGKTLSYIVDRESIVKTGPVKNLRALIIQRIRWGSKTTRYGISDIQLLAVLASLTNILVLLLPLWLLLFTSWWPWLVVGLFSKTLADFMLLHRITGVTRQREDLLLFLPVSLAYYPVFIITLFGSLLGKSAWKR